MDQAKPKRSPLSFLLIILCAALFGAWFGAWLAQNPAVRVRLDALSGWDALALLPLAFLAITAHELGHLLGGTRAGMRFLLLVVGPLRLTRSEGGLRLDWFFHPATFGGLAAAMPSPEKPLRPQLRGLVAGGPLASLLAGGLSLGVSALLSGRPGAYFFLFGALSLLIALATLIPTRAGGFMSDGMQLLELWRGGSAVEERQRLTTILSQSYAGERPRTWDAELLAQLAEHPPEEPLRRVAARLCALAHHLDRRELDAAAVQAGWLAEHYTLFPSGFRQSITVELSLFASLHQNDEESARRWWSLSRGGMVEPARRALAEASLALSARDPEAARRALDQARRDLPRSSDPGMQHLTRDQLDELTRQLSTTPPPPQDKPTA